jgi:hypothetical protein
MDNLGVGWDTLHKHRGSHFYCNPNTIHTFDPRSLSNAHTILEGFPRDFTEVSNSKTGEWRGGMERRYYIPILYPIFYRFQIFSLHVLL